MTAEKKVILRVGKEAWFRTYFQPSISAMVYHVEKDLFWTNLPRCEGQVLMLAEKQTVEVGISHAEGFYSTETYLVKTENKYDRFYGFAMPEHFAITQERQFMRASHAATVLFRTGGLSAQTALINFSAGGVMVFLVPLLKKIIDTRQEIDLTIHFEQDSVITKAVFSWEKSYDNVPFAGFRFSDIEEATRLKIDALVRNIIEDKP
jgi:c-di-GMP-binding flagellar brake protein YcgR